MPAAVEGAHTLGALARLEHKLLCPCVQPRASKVDRLCERRVSERAVVFLSHLVLKSKPARVNAPRDVGRTLYERGETLTAFDSGDAHTGAEIEVLVEASSGGRDLERPAAGDGGDLVSVGCGELATRCRLVGDEPARHGDLQRGHERRTLFEVRLDRDGIVAGIERTRPR